MKTKIFTFIAVVLFTGSMVAQVTEMTCAEARAAALAGSTEEVAVTGYVTSISTPYDQRFNNLSFWMADDVNGGEVILAYRCKPEDSDKLPEIGYLVKVTGSLTSYYGSAEFVQSCKCVIVENEQNQNLHVQVGDLYYNFDATSQTAEVTYQSQSVGNNYSGLASVDIPVSVTFDNVTYSVTSIGGGAFYGCTSLTSVTIPNSVTNIGDNAFFGCSGLTSVHISDITFWCNIGFYGSSSNPLFYAHNLYLNGDLVKDLVIPNGVTSISSAFEGCTSLISVIVPNSVTSIGNSAFSGCTSLTSVDIPNSVTSIGNTAFRKCTGLTSVDIPNSVTNIGNSAFRECTGLTSVDIPNSVTNIGNSAFYGCTGLTSVTIPNSVTSIGNHTFFRCTGLTSVETPNSVTSIGDYAFSGCTGLTSIEIPNSVTNIGSFVFSSCTGLTSVTIPNSVVSIGNSAFDSWSINEIHFGGTIDEWCMKSWIVNQISYKYTLYIGEDKFTNLVIPNTFTTIENNVISGCTSLISITIPNSVTSIGDDAFKGCTGLTSVTIPNSVYSIGNQAFSGCTGLTSIIVEIGNPTYDSRDDSNAIILTSSNTLIVGCQNTIIPNSVTSIGNSAFSNCIGLTSVDIPNSVTNIGNSAFHECTGLTSVDIPNSVTNIGNSAFYGCTSLTSVTIPNSVTSIGDYAFSGCTGLTSIEIPNSVTSIGDYAFRSVINIVYSGSATGSPWGAKSVNGCVDGFLVYSDDTKTILVGCSSAAKGDINIPSSVTSIENSAFYGCTGLISVTIPNSVTIIGDYAFSGCTGLTSIEIPNSVTSIGTDAFYDHYFIGGSLTLVTINSNTIVSAQYNNGASLKDIFGDQVTTYIIGNDVTSIGQRAFYYCTGLTSVTIPNSVVSIGFEAFCGCTSLTSIEIPNGVISLDHGAFSSCSSLTSVTIPTSVTSIAWWAFSGCTSLTSVHISDIAAWCNIGFYNTESNPLVYAHNLYLNGDLVKDLVIPNGVTSISSAFEGCISLTSVEIPNSVTNIGDRAFSGCTGLNSVIIPNSVTSIGSEAFKECTGLTSVEIPNSVTSIGENAFRFVNNLIYFGTATGSPWGAKSVNGYVEGYFVYSDDTKTTLLGCYSAATGEIFIPNSVTSIGDRAFYDCTKLTTVTLPNSVTNIGYNAFYNCIGLTSPVYNEHIFGCLPTSYSGTYVIPDGIEVIANLAFYNRIGLTSIEIPNSVTCIGDYAFYGCTGLTSVAIPEDVQKTGKYPFWGCANLSSVMWDAVNCTIYYDGQYSYPPFIECKNITSFTIGENVERIPDFLCYSLPISTIIIPNSVTIIGTGAFYDCTSLSSVTSEAVAPPMLTGYYVFENVNKHIPLYVPEESLDAYKAADQWKDFTKILAIQNTPTSIDNMVPYADTSANQQKATKFLRDGQILILRGNKAYTVTGQQVK